MSTNDSTPAPVRKKTAKARIRRKKKARSPTKRERYQRVATVKMALTDLTPADYNPRTMQKKAAQGLGNSISRFGLVQPIVFNKRSQRMGWPEGEEGVIVGGHQRLARLLEKNVTHTDVVVVDVNAVDEQAMNVALNNPAIQGDWTDDVFGILDFIKENAPDTFADVQLDALAEDLADVFEYVELGDSGPSGKPTPEPQISKKDQLQKTWKTQVGQLWIIGDVHRLYIGDSRERASVVALLGDDLIKCMWTDPPYGVNYVGKTKDALTIQNDGELDVPDLLRRCFDAVSPSMIPGCPFYIAHPAGPISVDFGLAVKETPEWLFHQTLVWEKDVFVMGRSDHHYRHEPIIYGWKKGKSHPWYGGRDKDTIFPVDRPKKSEEHPTMKPPELVETQLANSTKRGDLVFDPFGGSGTTLCAAINMERVGATIELDPGFAAVILERTRMMGLEAKLAEQQPKAVA